MDLALYGRTLWRHRGIVALGVILAAVLAFLAVAKVDLRNGSVSYRSSEVWQNSAKLLLTQRGFPEGRSVFPVTGQSTKTPTYADPGRFVGLTDFYAQIVTSDAIRRQMLAAGPIDGTVQAAAQLGATNNPTPIVNIFGSSDTPAKATALARRATNALLAYVATQQARARVPKSQRVNLQVLRSSDSPLLVEGRRKTLPVIVFLAVLTMTVALAFVLENVGRRSALESVNAEAAPSELPEEPRLVRTAGERIS